LVAAFRATLEEVLEADVLLHVVDITHPNVMEQVEAVHETLTEIGATDKPMINALNKIDRLDGRAEPSGSEESLSKLLDGSPNSVPISALTGQGITALLDRIEEELESGMAPVSVIIPYDRGDLVDLFHKRGVIEQETHEGQGTHIDGRLPLDLAARFKEFE
jgi:GTP-binding protein HflX